jgi:hypothetical protein
MDDRKKGPYSAHKPTFFEKNLFDPDKSKHTPVLKRRRRSGKPPHSRNARPDRRPLFPPVPLDPK